MMASSNTITLTLTGDSSNLTAQYFPPIELEKQSEYECGLVDFQAYNSIPNINETNNRIYYGDVCKFYLDVGRYNIANVQKIASQQNPKYNAVFFDQFESKFASALVKGEDGYYTVLKKTTYAFHGFDYVSIPPGSYEFDEIVKAFQTQLQLIGITLEIFMDKNTLKSVLKCDRSIDFTKKRNIGSVLGFKKRILIPNSTHSSENIIKITSLNTIRIDCNIANGSYLNNTPTHTIHEFC